MDEKERQPLTYDEHEAILIQLSNAGGDVGSMTEALQSLRDNYRYTSDSYSAKIEELNALNDKYRMLEKQNLELFMKLSSQETKEKENEDIEKDDEVEELSYDDLFDERQGG